MSSKFHVRRSHIAHERTLTQNNGLRSIRWETPKDGNSVLEVQTTHRPRDVQKLPANLNYLNPPYHWHWYQDEYFTIKQGRFIFTLEGKDFTASASDPQPVHVPVRARHAFKVDDTCDEPCTIVVETTVSPNAAAGSQGMSEQLFRNLYQYLDDCWVQGQSPSLFQLMVFIHSGEVSVALPGPAWLVHPLSYVLGLVIGVWIGKYVLGYKTSYPEYWDESGESKKEK